MQGAGQMLAAVVAFYADLQPLPPGNMIRNTKTVWPLAQAADFWSNWTQYRDTHYADESLVELSATYVTQPGLGALAGLGAWGALLAGRG